MSKQYKQSINVLWAASIIAQDAQGNTTERGMKVLAVSIQEALTKATLEAEQMSEDHGWDRWMIWDIGIIPDDCFQ